MAEREIRSVRALRRELAKVGVDVSEAQLGRIVNGRTKAVDFKLLAGLCEALDATPGELLTIPGRRPSGTSGSMPNPAPTPSPNPIELPPRPPGRPRATTIPRPKY